MTSRKVDHQKAKGLNNEFFDFYKNIGWGVLSSLFQNVLYSIFFIVIARQYETEDFASYIISNNLYGFVLSFSSLGLGQWFLREIQHSENKNHVRDKFLKLQVIIGFVFYIINLLLCYIIYNNNIVFILSIILGLNIILDNIISVFKFINIDGASQHKTFIYLSIEAILKFLLALVLFQYNLNIFLLCSLIVGVKLFSAILFFNYGIYCKIYYNNVVKIKLEFKEINKLITKNISFALIGGISVLFWSFGNIIVTKFLSINDIAYYDIIFKIFGMAQIIPVIFSATVFPKLVKAANKNLSELKLLAEKYYYLYFVYGITSYVFIYSYADLLIPFLFGSKYMLAISYCKEMFLTMIVFPVVLLQANILIALKKEKIDMWMNLIVLIMNILFCLLGVIFTKNLSIINYSIFASFIIFMIMQDTYLLKIKIQDTTLIINKYSALISFGISIVLTVLYVKEIWVFPVYLMVIGIIILSLQSKKMRNDVLVIVPEKLNNQVEHKP